MSQIRDRVDKTVKNKKVAEALKPWYRQWCKRPCFHDEYLETFNKENVTLVDTGGKDIEKIEINDFVVNGKRYPVDCIIFATGFDFFPDINRRLQCKIIGQENNEISEKWKDGSPLLGYIVKDFQIVLF